MINQNLGISDSVNKELKSKSGFYVLRSNQWPDGIPRLVNTDIKSILYIGKADNIYARVSSLQKSIISNSDIYQTNPVEKGHKSLSRKFYRIRKLVDTNKLFINPFVVPNINPEAIESLFLEYYVSEYGELPPLNGQYGKYHIQEALKLSLPFKKNRAYC